MKNNRGGVRPGDPRKVGSGQTGQQVAASVQPEMSDAELERIHKATSSMGTADRVHFWDKQQGRQVWAAADDHLLTAEELEADRHAEEVYAAVKHEIGDTRPTLIRHHLATHPDVILCGNDRSHGKLIAHGSGSLLMCGAHKGGAACTFTRPISI